MCNGLGLTLALTSAMQAGIKFLVFSKADVCLQDKYGHSALHLLSAYCSDSQAFMTILAANAALDARTCHFNTPLHVAAMNGNEVRE